jgi:hypothetical protein
MLFLPDKSYYTLNPYESQLIHYDSRGTRTILRSGQIGSDLVYLPSGALMARVSGIGMYEYYPSGKLKLSSMHEFAGREWARYVVDREGNTYYFERDELHRIDPLGAVTSITEGPDCPSRMSIEGFQFSEADHSIYSVCAQGSRSWVVRYSMDGQVSTFYSNPYDVEHGTLDIDSAGNVYYVYHRLDDYTYEVVRLDAQGVPAKVFSKGGRWGDETFGVISCAKERLDSYLVLSCQNFVMYRLAGDGSIQVLDTATPVVGADFLGIETSPEGDVYVISPGFLYRFSENGIGAAISVPDTFQQVTASIGSITDVVIPGNGFNGDTAVEIDAPGCWVYQREATSGALKFKLAVRPNAALGEYDIILHNPGRAAMVLENALGIGVAKGSSSPEQEKKPPVRDF